MIQGLEAGEEYVLKETKTPDGYATFKTQTFTAEEGKDTSLSMVDEDTKGEVSKQDISTKKELKSYLRTMSKTPSLSRTLSLCICIISMLAKM